MNRPFQTGLLVGRFQPPHCGHDLIIGKALELCDSVIVLIGSSQEARTLKNPFTYEERKMLLERMYDDRIAVYPLPDIGVGNNCAWGAYVYAKAKSLSGKVPDLFISGEESRRSSWFADVEDCDMALLSLPKTIDISATALRTWLLEDDKENWKRYTNDKLWELFPAMQKIIRSCQDKTETASI